MDITVGDASKDAHPDPEEHKSTEAAREILHKD